jgi:hypothetical protein
VKDFAHCSSGGNGSTVGAAFGVKKEIPVKVLDMSYHMVFSGKPGTGKTKDKG